MNYIRGNLWKICEIKLNKKKRPWVCTETVLFVLFAIYLSPAPAQTSIKFYLRPKQIWKPKIASGVRKTNYFQIYDKKIVLQPNCLSIFLGKKLLRLYFLFFI